MKKVSCILNYFKSMSCIIVMGMLSMILLSILLVGVNKNIKKDSVNRVENNVNEFNSDNNLVVYHKYDGKGPKIKVYITKDKKIKEIYLEEYIKGVVAGEMPANFHIEALKSQAVAARTYAVAHMKKFGASGCKNGKGADICDTVHCQVYMSKEERLKSWPSNTKNKLWDKISKAVTSTAGEVLTFEDKLVLQPYYFSTSSGNTENAKDVFATDVPYLRSVSSPGEERAPKYESEKKYTIFQFTQIVNSNYLKAKLSNSNLKNNVKILKRTSGGVVESIKLGNVNIKGIEFRKLMKLNSANFNLVFDKDVINIKCKGYGHGVGMSQWGADAMGKNNKNYKQILTHYYNGTKIKNIDSIFKWK